MVVVKKRSDGEAIFWNTTDAAHLFWEHFYEKRHKLRRGFVNPPILSPPGKGSAS
jgi:hypothetical protein